MGKMGARHLGKDRKMFFFGFFCSSLDIWGKWGVAYGGTWVGERKQNSKQMPAMCGETGGATYWEKT